MKLHKSIKIAFITICSLSMVGCYIESHESDSNEDWPASQTSNYYPSYETSPSDIPQGDYLLIADLCERDDLDVRLSEGTKKKVCFENQDYKWNTSCRGGQCEAVPVYVQYMLSEDLGASRSVTVEAFDNPRFVGSPVSSVTIQNFTAQKAEQFQKADLSLGTGT